MSDTYRTDEEQVEAIKRWWRENGTSTVVSIAIAVSAVLGWQAWQKNQQEKIDTASAIYQNLVTAAAGDNGSATVEQKATVMHLAQTLKSDFPDSTYAQFAAFYRAKFSVEDKDLEAAEKELRWVLESGASNEIVIQTQLRLARVLAAKDDYQQALQLLDKDSAGYSGVYKEVKGDIYRAQGEIEKAITAYEQALDANQKASNTKPNPLLDMKIQQLKSERGSLAVQRATEG